MIDEQLRLDELRRYDVLDSERDPAFDRLVELAALSCQAPVALLTFLDEDRQWFKAAHGVELSETPRQISFCAHALREARLLVVEDTTRDPRFAGNPFVAGREAIRFYAGAPLVTPRGLVLGTLCVLDRRPRKLDRESERALLMLRDTVMMALENRRELIELRRSEGLRQEAVEALLATKTDLEARVELRTREVQAARERIQAILARVADGFVALDRTWHYTYVNERAARMFNRTPEQLIGKQIWTEFPEGVGQPFHQAYERAMREQVPVTMTDYYAPWDRWFENRIYPSPEGLTIFFTEITARRRAEEALADSARRLAEAQEVAHVGSWEWSVGEDRVRWSAEMHRIYGVSPEGFQGSYEGFLSHVHPDDLEHTKAVIGDAYQHPKRFTYDHRIVRTDGTVRMLHTVGDVMVDEAGRVLRMVGSCWDTTEQWLATQKLERAAALVDTLVGAVSDAVLVIDEAGQVRAASPACKALFELPAALCADGADGVSLLDQIARRTRDADAFRALARQSGAVTAMLQVDGRVVECSARPCRSDAASGRVWTFRPR